MTAEHAKRAEKSNFLLAIAEPLNSADVQFPSANSAFSAIKAL
jgi:hypothetical protein